MICLIVRSMRLSNEIVYLKLKGLIIVMFYNIEGKKYKGGTLMNHGIMTDQSEKYGDCVIFEFEPQI